MGARHQYRLSAWPRGLALQERLRGLQARRDRLHQVACPRGRRARHHRQLDLPRLRLHPDRREADRRPGQGAQHSPRAGDPRRDPGAPGDEAVHRAGGRRVPRALPRLRFGRADQGRRDLHRRRLDRALSMLRRRRRTLKPGSARDTRRAPDALQWRRRRRPDAAVPRQLLVKDATLSPRGGSPSAEQGRGRTSEVVLVTGFEPFGGEGTNPSWEICERLPREIAGMRVQTCRVPCEFRRSIEVVANAIEAHRPLLVVCVGQAGGRAKLGVERIAINVDDARMPDNAGARPLDEPIAANGPPAYFATLPVKAMAVAMRAAGVPAEASNSAGTYVCNHLMYGVLHYLAASGQRTRVGFIHVPYSEEQVIDRPAMPAMALETMVLGIEAAIVAAHRHPADHADRLGRSCSEP